ncbi:MAG: hypothetical protein F6J93_38545 [Oscillatoria sp. SIO1A7]|nr:hypothetical protein [Oscillatoria sp. SIO1A7]
MDFGAEIYLLPTDFSAVNKSLSASAKNIFDFGLDRLPAFAGWSSGSLAVLLGPLAAESLHIFIGRKLEKLCAFFAKLEKIFSRPAGKGLFN